MRWLAGAEAANVGLGAFHGDRAETDGQRCRLIGGHEVLTCDALLETDAGRVLFFSAAMSTSMESRVARVIFRLKITGPSMLCPYRTDVGSVLCGDLIVRWVQLSIPVRASSSLVAL